jgi:hypothetical protein
MACCEPEVERHENRYGVWTTKTHSLDCPYSPRSVWRGDATPAPKPEIPEGVAPQKAMQHWMTAPVDHDCEMCAYIENHLDDEDDLRIPIVDTDMTIGEA